MTLARPADAGDAAAIAKHVRSPTLMMLVLLAVVGSLLYGSFLFNPANAGDPLPYTLVIIAETYLLVQVMLALWTVLASGFNPRTFGFFRARSQLFPAVDLSVTVAVDLLHPLRMPMCLRGEPITVDVFVTTCGEDIRIIHRTALSARDMIGGHRTYLLDDGKSDRVALLARELGIGYLRRDGNAGAKAGNINHALRHTTGRFFAVFDADFVPDRAFLVETVPFFENSRIAFVQTPQHYDNKGTVISRGAGYMQHVFYSLIQPGKNRFNAAFCVGTNVIFRRSAIEDIGGMCTSSKSEDIWTSIYLHEKGYESVYIPNVLAIGKTPETVKAYCKQQLRWATGGFEVLLHHCPLRRKRHLTIDQRLQYFATTIHYVNGIAAFLLLLLPPLQIYFNLTPVNLHISTFTWAVYYSGFYLMQILVAFYTMGGFRPETLILSNASFPIYVRAFWNALFRRDQPWHVTGRAGSADSPFHYIRPQVTIFVFLLGTSVLGWWKAGYTDRLSVSVVWNTINTLVLGTFVLGAVRESRGTGRSPDPADAPSAPVPVAPQRRSRTHA